MSKRLVPLLLLAAVACLAPRDAAAATQEHFALADDLACTLAFPFAEFAGGGVCVPVRLEFANGGPDRTVRVVLESAGSVTQTFSVTGGGNTHRWMYLPMLGDRMWAGQASFYDGATGRLLKREYLGGLSLSMQDAVAAVVHTGRGRTISSARAPTVSSDLCAPQQLSVFNVSPDLLPDSWRGLTPLSLVIVTEAAWNSPRLDRASVLDWVAMGGTCWLVDASAGAREDVWRAVEERLPAVERAEGGVAAGLGQVMFVESKLLLRAGAFAVGARTAYSSGTSQEYPLLDVVGRPPFVPVLVFLVLFSLLVGPLGWWYLVSRRGKPFLYYALAPVLSACVIAVIIVADVLKQGVRVKASCSASELVDQRVNRRIVISQFALYCPFTLGKALRGGLDQRPYFLSRPSDDGYRGGSRFGLGGVNSFVTAADVVYGDALPAREKAWYAFRALQHDRRRLTVWSEDGDIYAENHLGAPLRELLVCHEGEYAFFDRLPEGQKAAGEPLDRAEASRRASQLARDHYTVRVAGLAQGDTRLNVRWSRAFNAGRNSYVALRDGKFEELTWLDSARFSGSVSVIRGLY